VDMDRTLSVETITQGLKLVLIHVHGINDTYHVLLDTGAEFSVINKKIVDMKNYIILKPTGPRFINLANSATIPRIGKVSITIDILFPCSERPMINSRKHLFEVLETSHDFIIGMDLLPIIFPGDEIMEYVSFPKNFDQSVAINSLELSSMNHVNKTYQYTDIDEIPSEPLQPSMFSKKYKTALRINDASPIPVSSDEPKPKTIASNYSKTIEKQMKEMEEDIRNNRQYKNTSYYYRQSVNDDMDADHIIMQMMFLNDEDYGIFQILLMLINALKKNG
jgi:hypothetical protein